MKSPSIPRNPRSWWNLQNTGGLTYHYLARRYGPKLWWNFTHALNQALANWRTPQTQLVLVGPSAGYCLPPALLSRFTRIAAIDLDPLAPALFSRQHPGRQVEWSQHDYFFDRRGAWQPQGPTQLIDDHPEHAILFCNILGQLTRYSERSNFADWRRNFQTALTQINYFSFHDLFSSETRPEWPASIELAQGEFAEGLAELKRRFAAHQNEKRASPRRPEPLLLRDHLTNDLFPVGPRKWELWSITPKAHHIIELRKKFDNS